MCVDFQSNNNTLNMSTFMHASRKLAGLVSRPLLTNTDRASLFRSIINGRFYCAMTARVQTDPDFFFRQYFDDKSWTYSYLLADLESKEAVIIDPGEFWNFFLKSALASSLLDMCGRKKNYASIKLRWRNPKAQIHFNSSSVNSRKLH